MFIATYKPLTALEKIFESDRFFDWRPEELFPARSYYSHGPRVNIVETEDQFILKAQVPGLKEGDIDLEFKDGVLTFSHLKKEESEKTEGVYKVREFRDKTFERSFRLGEQVDADQIKARLEHGMLTVILPKKEEIKPRRIEIRTES